MQAQETGAEENQNEEKKNKAANERGGSNRKNDTHKGDYTAARGAKPVDESDENLKGWDKVRSVLVPSRSGSRPVDDGMAAVVRTAMRGRNEGPNADVPIHSKILFKTTTAENKMMRFRPSDFFPPNMKK